MSKEIEFSTFTKMLCRYFSVTVVEITSGHRSWPDKFVSWPVKKLFDFVLVRSFRINILYLARPMFHSQNKGLAVFSRKHLFILHDAMCCMRTQFLLSAAAILLLVVEIDWLIWRFSLSLWIIFTLSLASKNILIYLLLQVSRFPFEYGYIKTNSSSHVTSTQLRHPKTKPHGCINIVTRYHMCTKIGCVINNFQHSRVGWSEKYNFWFSLIKINFAFCILSWAKFPCSQSEWDHLTFSTFEIKL